MKNYLKSNLWFLSLSAACLFVFSSPVEASLGDVGAVSEQTGAVNPQTGGGSGPSSTAGKATSENTAETVRQLKAAEETRRREGVSDKATQTAVGLHEAAEKQYDRDNERNEKNNDRSLQVARDTDNGGDNRESISRDATIAASAQRQQRTGAIAAEVFDDFVSNVYYSASYDPPQSVMPTAAGSPSNVGLGAGPWVAKFFAMNCSSGDPAGLGPLCNQMGAMRAPQDDQNKYHPVAFRPGEVPEMGGANKFEYAQAGGGGDSKVKNSAINLGKMNERDNCPLDANNPCTTAVLVATLIRSPIAGPIITGNNSPATMEHNFKVIQARAAVGATLTGLVCGAKKSFSVNGNCPQDQYVDQTRQAGGLPASQGQCRSQRETEQAGIVARRFTRTASSRTPAGSPARGAAEDSSRSMEKDIDAGGEGCSGGGGGGTNGVTPTITSSLVPMLEDPRFYAAIRDPQFPKMVAYYESKLPEIYAEQNIRIAAIVKQYEDGSNTGTYYAQNPVPKTVPSSVTPAKPLEKSASLSQLFAASGVALSGTGMPMMPVVEKKDMQEPAMKAILVSAPVN